MHDLGGINLLNLNLGGGFPGAINPNLAMLGG